MLYTIAYQPIKDKYPTEVEFATELDMENYYNNWVFDEECFFCHCFYCNREYTPKWME